MAKRKRTKRNTPKKSIIKPFAENMKDTGSPIILDNPDIKRFVNRWDDIFGFSIKPPMNKLIGCYPLEGKQWEMQALIESDIRLSTLNMLAENNKNIRVDDIEISGDLVEVSFALTT